MLTGPEVAELTGYDISTICRWARAGTLGDAVIRKTPGIRGTWLFWPAVLDLIHPKGTADAVGAVHAR